MVASYSVEPACGGILRPRSVLHVEARVEMPQNRPRTRALPAIFLQLTFGNRCKASRPKDGSRPRAHQRAARSVCVEDDDDEGQRTIALGGSADRAAMLPLGCAKWRRGRSSRGNGERNR